MCKFSSLIRRDFSSIKEPNNISCMVPSRMAVDCLEYAL